MVNRYRRIALWLIVHGGVLLLLLSGRLTLSTDVYSLVYSGKDKHVANALLHKTLSMGRFAITGPSDSEVERIATELLHRLRELSLGEPLEISTDIQRSEQLAAGLGAVRHLLLSSSQGELLRRDNPVDAILLNIQEKLFSPLATQSSAFLAHDPLLLLLDILPIDSTARQQSQSIDQRHGSNNRVTHVMQWQFPPGTDDRARARIDSQVAGLLEDPNWDSTVSVRWSAPLRFEASSAHRARHDIERLSLVASAILLVLVAVVFRHIAIFPLVVASIVSGLLFGVSVVQLLFGSMHILTLALGCALMGACIDYAVHAFGAQRFEDNRSVGVVLGAVMLAALTTALAFSPLLLSSFSGLRELAVFSMAAVAASATTVTLLTPAFATSPISQPPWAIVLSHSIAVLARHRRALIVVFAIVAIVGFERLESNDDIRILQTPDSALLENEQWFMKSTAKEFPEAFLLVEADNDPSILREVLGRLNTLKASTTISSFSSVPILMPDFESQRASVQAYEEFLTKHSEALRARLLEFGYEEHLVDTATEKPHVALHTMVDFVGLLPNNMSALLTLEVEETLYLPLSLSGVQDWQVVREELDSLSFATLFSPTQTISENFTRYRIESGTIFLATALLGLGVLHWLLQLRPESLFVLVAAPIGALGATGLLGVQLNFFSLFALLPVLGLALDFVILLERSTRFGKSAHMTVFISGTSTSMTFATLMMSSTEVLRSVGLIVASGVLSAMVLSLVLLGSNGEDETL